MSKKSENKAKINKEISSWTQKRVIGLYKRLKGVKGSCIWLREGYEWSKLSENDEK